MKMNFLKKIFGGIFNVVIKPIGTKLKTAFVEGTLLQLISTSSINLLQAIGGAGLAYFVVKTIIKKAFVKTSKCVAEVGKESKDSVIDAVTESINRDQDVNQDIVRYGYTEKEIAKNPEVKEVVDRFNAEKGRITKSELGNYKPGKKAKRKERRTFKAVNDYGTLIFLKEMKEDETKEDCNRILKDLMSKGLVGGPWVTNPYKDRIRAIYG